MDEFNRQWIIKHAEEIIDEYAEPMTLRQLHYRLVAIGMTNDVQHYKRVLGAMKAARWDGIIEMEAFIDRERDMFGETEYDEKDLASEIESGKYQIKAWMRNYRLNRWFNQDNYIEVWIEKKALQGVFERPCQSKDVGLAPCKGYPSITFLNEAKDRFLDAKENGKKLVILYFGDYDPSGADIPRSLQENLRRMGVDVDVKRIALNSDLIKELNLPGVPPKRTDSRTSSWSGGDVVELDAVEPNTLRKMCADAINDYFDVGLYDELKERQKKERAEYQAALKEYVNDLGDDDEDDEEA